MILLMYPVVVAHFMLAIKENNRRAKKGNNEI